MELFRTHLVLTLVALVAGGVPYWCCWRMLIYRSTLPIIVFWALVVASLFFSSAFYLAFFGFVPILFTSVWAMFFLNAISFEVEGDYLGYVALAALIPTQMFSVVLFTEIRYWKPVRCLIVQSPFHDVVYLAIVLLLPTLLGFLIWWAKKRQRPITVQPL